MPLRKDTLYTIHNDLTHTVLDMSAEAAVRGWGWRGKPNQQWKLEPIDIAQNEWRILNQQYNGHYLSRNEGDVNRRLIGAAPDTFVIQQVPGPSERYRIKFGTSAVALVTGIGVEPPNNAVHDLQADGSPVFLRAVADAPAASIWSFRPVAKLPLADGTYQIVNNRTGTVLGIAANNRAQGEQSQANEPKQKWIVTKDGDGDSYTFKNSAEGNLFLGTPDPLAAGTVLQAQAAGNNKFTIRKVPDANYYKIFLAPANDNGVSRLAVNLSAQDQGVYPVTLQAAKAETWSFN